MKRKQLFALIALTVVFAMAFCACGKDTKETQPVQESLQADQPLGLASWEMSATTWSSPNGATVNLNAVPTRRADGDSAVFVARLEGEEIARVVCDFDGSRYTASLDLNAADGYCYYVIMTGGDGAQTEVAVNTPTSPIDETLIDIESSLNSYCSVVVTDCSFDGKWLTITNGQVQIQPPRIANGGETVLCSEAVLVLSRNGETIDSVSLALPDPGVNGGYDLQITTSSFQIPQMEDDQQLALRLDVTLSNGQTLTAPGGTWFYNDSQLLLAVG
ncbi:MAG: hypothetical protein ACI4PH_11455 [Faecousia sp.]